MQQTGATLRRGSVGGETAGAPARRARAAAAAAAAALCVLPACATRPRSPGPSAAQLEALRANVDAGLDLYDAGDFPLAAHRFRAAADGAARCRDLDLQTRALTAECTAWLRAQRPDELARCTERLERLQVRQPRSDPGVNTLLALGAVAGQRPLPPLRIPNAVRPFVHETAEESR